jgi:hypothetical protein
VLRQLWRLTRPVPAAGPNALAVAIYEHPTGVVHAEESGFEGVACVDDTARLLTVLCTLEADAPAWVERWARGLLDFVLWMQEPDGAWINFVTDWDGDKNRTGITSEPGQNFWLARALVATQTAGWAFGDSDVIEAYRRGLAVAAAEEAPPDIRSLHLLTALFGDDPEPSLARRWADEIAACRDGAVLKNSPYEVGAPHLWAHIQEGALALASTLLEDPALLDIAVRSAEAVIEPAVHDRFAATPRSLAYDVSSCVWSLDQLARATEDERWGRLAADARGWFDGRNTAGRPIYDRERGAVADGIDNGRVSMNSGAESNIVAAAIFPQEAVAVADRMQDPFAVVP